MSARRVKSCDVRRRSIALRVSFSLLSAKARSFSAVLPGNGRQRAGLHHAGHRGGVADGHPDAVGLHGGAGANRKHCTFAAVRSHRRVARGHRRPAPGDPDHSARAVRIDAVARARHPGRSDRPGDAAGVHVSDRRRIHFLPPCAAGKRERSGLTPGPASGGGAGRHRLQSGPRCRPCPGRRDRCVDWHRQCITRQRVLFRRDARHSDALERLALGDSGSSRNLARRRAERLTLCPPLGIDAGASSFTI